MGNARAVVSAAAVAQNIATLDAHTGDAMVCAVVKADGYGHGAVEMARTALGAGARWLGVATVDEAATLRAAGIDAPILVLSEPGIAELDRALVLDVDMVAYRREFLDALAARCSELGVPTARVHLKVDTGMGRVGCMPGDVVGLARLVAAAPTLELAGTMTHLAVADEQGNPTTARQLDTFDDSLAELTAAGIDPGLRHAANSAAAIAHPRSHLDLVRVGIATYGIAPAPAMVGALPLQPALRWESEVRFVKRVAAGSAVSYGHRHRFDVRTRVATVPVGYADGVRRDLGLRGGAVLIAGRRCPVRGAVTMDQLVAEVPDDVEVRVGDEVVLIGTQGDEAITATEIASLLDTIGYEVTCSIGSRVERRWQ